MADNDNLQQQAEQQRQKTVAQQKKPKPKIRQRGGTPSKPDAETKARLNREAAAKNAKRKADAEAARKKRAEELRVTQAYRRALDAARRAAEQYNNTGNTNDMVAFDRAKSALTAASAEFKKVTGQAVETVRISPKQPTPVKGVLPGTQPAYTVKPTGATGPVTVSSEAPRARRVPGAAPATSMVQGPSAPLMAATGLGGYSPDIINTVMKNMKLGSPAEAVKWLQDHGVQPTAPTGSTGPGGGGGGAPSRTVSTQRQVQRFTTQQLEATATRVAQDALGRALTADELARITGVVNKEAAKNPTISRTVTRYKGANTSSSTTTKGGIDEAQVIKSQVAQGDEYSAYQTATTYFDAMMSALRGPAGGSL